MFTKQNKEMRVDNENFVDTMRYFADNDILFTRK